MYHIKTAGYLIASYTYKVTLLKTNAHENMVLIMYNVAMHPRTDIVVVFECVEGQRHKHEAPVPLPAEW